MKLKMRLLLPTALLVTCSPFTFAQGSPEVVERILVEGKQNSHVWETLTYLSKEIGPRLTGSASLDRASAWTRDEFHRLGLKNAHLQKWGEVPVRFDRGPSFARMTAPSEREFEFTTRSWGAGTDGPVSGRVFPMPKSLEELDGIVHDLEGAWVLTERTRRGRGRRNETDEERTAREEREAIAAEVDSALAECGIVGRLTSSGNELALTGAVNGWRNLTIGTLPTDIDVQIRKSDYEALAAEIESGAEVQVEVDLANHFTEGPFGVFNTIAEIPGTEKPEEVVIFSGHLDSWDGPGSEGAQDNGTGCSVMLEAARILMAADVKPKRTIRFILWTGEEQGLFGSRGYVESLSEEERALVSACFVDDGGTNYQGGLLCIESMKTMLDAAIAPVMEAFPDLPMENTVRDRMPRGGGSDHASFNQVGIPGFFWNEAGSGGREGKNYTFVHHTQHDTMRYAVEEYLVQAATCSAVVAYQLAQAETLLPRQLAESETEAEAEPVVDPTFVVEAGAFSGDWDVALVGDDVPDVNFTVSIETAADGRLRGFLDGRSGKEKLTEGKWDGGAQTASFACASDFGTLRFTARVDEGALVGTMDVGGMEMAFRGERIVTIASPISGLWKGVIMSMDADITMSFEVAADGSLSGRFKSSQSDSALYDAKWDAETLSLSFEYDYPHAGRLPVVARLEGDKLVGTIGESADFEATRATP